MNFPVSYEYARSEMTSREPGKLILPFSRKAVGVFFRHITTRSHGLIAWGDRLFGATALAIHKLNRTTCLVRPFPDGFYSCHRGFRSVTARLLKCGDKPAGAGEATAWGGATARISV